jgi:hypothetical protein
MRKRMGSFGNRSTREVITVEKMINLYCKKKHKTQNTRCGDCEKLYNYSRVRIGDCRYGDNKPACSNCRIHCFKPEMREEIIKVMRYSGPKMITKYPILALYHFIDSKINDYKK